MFFILVFTPIVLSVFVSIIPVGICGIIASILSITCSLTPLEKIVNNNNFRIKYIIAKSNRVKRLQIYKFPSRIIRLL